jgi:hypothetical protein
MREQMKQVYSYSEVGALIGQRTKTIFTRSAQVRVSVMKPSGKSHTIKVSINLLIGTYSVGVFQCTYKNILELLEAFDINENEEIFEVCSYYSQP